MKMIRLVFSSFKHVNRIFPKVIRLVFLNLKIFRNRVFLTIFGILYGTVSVISTFTVSGNLGRMADEELQKVGTDVISLSAKLPFMGIDLSSISSLVKFCPAISEVAPFVSFASNLGTLDKYNYTTIFGVDARYLELKKLGIRIGRDFKPYDKSSRLAIIGSSLADDNFGHTNPIGKIITLKINSGFLPFKVIGVIHPQPQLKLISSKGTPDSSVYIPFSLAYSGLGQTNGASVLVRAKKKEGLADARLQSTSLLKIKYGENLDVYDPHDEIAKAKSLTDGIIFSGLAIGILSLFSGGVGIMNIMLISVDQRKREIGLYKALGFKNRIILIEFLAEALAINFLGVLIGTLIGAPTGSYLSQRLFNGYGEVDVMSIVISWVFSLVVGLSFGYLPAKKAAKLDPVEALKN